MAQFALPSPSGHLFIDCHVEFKENVFILETTPMIPESIPTPSSNSIPISKLAIKSGGNENTLDPKTSKPKASRKSCSDFPVESLIAYHYL